MRGRSMLALRIDPHGLTIILVASHGGSLHTGQPIYYRGIEVGAVRQARLSTNSTTVKIECVIRQRYANLVRPESRFWNVTGLEVRVGLFRGAELSIESLKSLFLGGIAMARAGPRTMAAGINSPRWEVRHSLKL